MAKRQAVSKRTRFEVFKRDGFKCTFCGRCPPEIVLRVDHLHPVSKGGGRDMLNLVTACFDCNAGKSDVLLSDDAALVKQRAQLELLNERREQLEMMVKWRQGLNEIEAVGLQHAVDAFNDLTERQLSVNDTGRATLKKLIHKHGLADVLEAIQSAGNQYIEYKADGTFDQESASIAFSKLGPICRGKNLSEDERQLLYIRGICRNRMEGCIEWECIKLLRNAHESGASIEYLKKLSLDTDRWSTWRRWMREVVHENSAEDEFPGWRYDSDIAVRRGAAIGVVATPGETLEAFVARIDRAVTKLF